MARQGVASVANRDDAQLKVDVAKADLAAAQSALDLDTVHAPTGGQVIAIHARAGERVGPDGIAELASNDAMYAVAEVYETDIARVKVGQRARVSSPAVDPPLTGTVERIGMKIGKQDVLDTDPVARVDARVVDVRIRLDDSKRAAPNAPSGRPWVEAGRRRLTMSLRPPTPERRMTDRLLRVDEAAELLGVKPATLYQWAYQRRIPW